MLRQLDCHVYRIGTADGMGYGRAGTRGLNHPDERALAQGVGQLPLAYVGARLRTCLRTCLHTGSGLGDMGTLRRHLLSWQSTPIANGNLRAIAM